jgi:hypothetical protein
VLFPFPLFPGLILSPFFAHLLDVDVCGCQQVWSLFRIQKNPSNSKRAWLYFVCEQIYIRGRRINRFLPHSQKAGERPRSPLVNLSNSIPTAASAGEKERFPKTALRRISLFGHSACCERESRSLFCPTARSTAERVCQIKEICILFTRFGLL